MKLAKPIHWFLSAVALLLGVCATIQLGLSETWDAVMFAGAALLGTWGVTPAVVSPALASKFKGVSVFILALLAATAAHAASRPAPTDATIALVVKIAEKALGIVGTILAALGQGASGTKAAVAAAEAREAAAGPKT